MAVSESDECATYGGRTWLTYVGYIRQQEKARPDRRRDLRPFGDVFEGFLAARKLPGDWFELDPTATRIQRWRAGRVYRLGDPLDVKVERIERPTGKVGLSPG